MSTSDQSQKSGVNLDETQQLLGLTQSDLDGGGRFRRSLGDGVGHDVPLPGAAGSAYALVSWALD